MHIGVIQRLAGLLIMLFSFSLMPPVVVDIIYDENTTQVFLYSYVVLVVTGFLLFFPARNNKSDLRLRDGFVVVVLFWAGLGLTGAIPLVLADRPHMSFTDAVFESLSALLFFL